MLSLSLPCVSLFTDLGKLGSQCLDFRMQLAGIHGQLDAVVLRLGELQAKLDILRRDGQDRQRNRAVAALHYFSGALIAPTAAALNAAVRTTIRAASITV